MCGSTPPPSRDFSYSTLPLFSPSASQVRESLGGIKAAIDDNQARTREKIKVKEEQNRKRSGSGGSNASLDLNLMEDEVDFTTTL